ncbi:codanin-1 [Ostrinia furnacalis]|uniref:codanin-1 n=1 Tax=Ostrinia furnacalis TaxID=93504 RepID=UPI00103C4DCD|nr:codanin-1 [Ostrinia furnacalis]
MPDIIIESVLKGKLDCELLFKWLNNEEIEDPPEDCILFCCNRNEFVAYFLSYLRTQTESVLQTNSNAPPPLHQTPEKVLNPRRKHRRSISDPTSDDRKDTLSVKSTSLRSQESPSKDRKRTGRRVKTKLFDDSTISSDESRISTGMEKVFVSSTPMKSNSRSELPATSPVTPLRSFMHERCDTPRLSHRHRSHEKSCLGDYLVGDFAQKSSKKKKGRNASDSSEPVELDLSNSDAFPEIGARKASSLRSDKRRIKPTNIDKSTSKKSVSLNSFNSDYFQQSSVSLLEDNAVFKQQSIQSKEASGFDAERSMLKQERHKLMEKFNILNTTASPKPVAPKIKVTQKESFEQAKTYIKSDSTKIVFKEKLDLLCDIYDILMNNNLILSVSTEIYFLISILLSKQCEEEYKTVESNLKDNNFEYLMKSIHNSTYFAVKCLWNMRTILEVVLDRNSLKILGENKKVRAFYPDLAKFLLNSYGLKCELEGGQQEKKSVERISNGVICFNHETDNVDNFPSVMSFQNFKKQRDMFYEIVRWYQETTASGGSLSSFRARIKTLLSCGQASANYAHLAALFTQHMLAECLPANTQESKLSKLQRRLTCPTNAESHRLPAFSTKETFYASFIRSADGFFRVHLQDAVASSLVSLDAAPGLTSHPDVSKDYHSLAKKLCLLGKFSGFVAALPYSLAPETARPAPHQPPRGRAAESEVAQRNHSQPTLDLKGMLTSAYQTSRLIITVPWVVHYLSMLDYASLRIPYYQELLKILRHIYINRLKTSETFLKKNTVIFLKCTLGWLFDLPHFPQDITCDNNPVISEVNIDCSEVIDEVILFDLCPYLRDVNVLLSTCKVSHDQKDVGTFRHITPVSLTLNPEDRLRNKERELQSRLEEEMLKSQPSSTRRVLELVTERVAAATVRELARPLATAREQVAARAARTVRERAGMTQAALLQSLQTLYSEKLDELRTSALEGASVTIKRRASSALRALLPQAPLPLQALAANNCLSKVRRWLQQNWTRTDVLCKDIEAEMKNLIAVGAASAHKAACSQSLTVDEAEWAARSTSPAATLIHLKEQICLLLEDEEPTDLQQTLIDCAACCAPENVFRRPPTQKALLQLSVELCLVYVSKKPLEVTESFLNQLHSIWNVCCPDRKRSAPEELTLPERRPDLSPEFRNFDDDRVPTPVSDEDGPPVTNIKIVTVDSDSEVKVVDKVNDEISDENLEFFDRILCPRNIVLLSSSKSKPTDVWEALATVLVFLLKNAYLSEDSLTEQCLAVYRQDWPQNILENLSTCMKSVSSRWSRSSTGKFTLFLDFLAEYCGDMDYEPAD